MEKEIEAYGETKRIGGATRYETSVLVADTFVKNPEAVVLAYAMNFPDGLCGGALAASMDAPLILTLNGQQDAVSKYTKDNGINQGFVLGGTVLISNDTVKKAFNLDASTIIVEWK